MRISWKSRVLAGSATSLVAALTAVSLLPSAASAATTTLRGGSEIGESYAGGFQAKLLGEAIVATTIGSGSCDQSTMTGAFGANGNTVSVTAATFGTNKACGGGSLKIEVTPQDLPWNGTVAHAPVAGGRDGTITLNNLKIKADVSFFGTVTCFYGGNLTFDSFNPTNTNRPFPAVQQQQIRVNGATANKLDGSNWMCPATAQVSATYQLAGQSSTGEDVPLFITG